MRYVRQPDARFLANRRRLRESVVSRPPRDREADRLRLDVEVLALELSPARVNAITPGLIDTPPLHTAYGAERDTIVKNRAAILPGRRVGTAEEVAQVILMLMTNAYLTGDVVHVGGGGRFASQ
jgi:enoyl-[acyl-carrier-protein] reductase (NADH)